MSPLGRSRVALAQYTVGVMMGGVTAVRDNNVNYGVEASKVLSSFSLILAARDHKSLTPWIADDFP